jgi:hypothetical protein
VRHAITKRTNGKTRRQTHLPTLTTRRRRRRSARADSRPTAARHLAALDKWRRARHRFGEPEDQRVAMRLSGHLVPPSGTGAAGFAAIQPPDLAASPTRPTPERPPGRSAHTGRGAHAEAAQTECDPEPIALTRPADPQHRRRQADDRCHARARTATATARRRTRVRTSGCSAPLTVGRR